ncbi:heat shock protein, alpha-crystallin-related, b15 [Neoarius graeffei]|uniref:heat shock protein, alpha-crystallin-related, b15 n=1 Tax=Neoarius graeffei TaxID=443677 RepID=UPI00298CBCC6|nr:heat shock protein, alpha-crystallin-related, b15 [Neoarius graeffei]
MSRPLFNRNGSWDPLQDWPKSSILNWCRGAPFFLELDDSSWLKTARKTLETSSWPGFRSLSLVTPVCPEVPHSSRDGHVECDPKTWRISLDVSTFCPEEIGVKINAGYLEVVGKHEERHYNQGATSRTFTRKYKLPTDVDQQKMNSSLSPEGVLLIEVPVGASYNRCPGETVIPVQMKEKH